MINYDQTRKCPAELCLIGRRSSVNIKLCHHVLRRRHHAFLRHVGNVACVSSTDSCDVCSDVSV